MRRPEALFQQRNRKPPVLHRIPEPSYVVVCHAQDEGCAPHISVRRRAAGNTQIFQARWADSTASEYRCSAINKLAYVRRLLAMSGSSGPTARSTSAIDWRSSVSGSLFLRCMMYVTARSDKHGKVPGMSLAHYAAWPRPGVECPRHPPAVVPLYIALRDGFSDRFRLVLRR